ncbi:MAG: phosphonate ABC transporter ATP-binding protein [Lautropia sp.]
MQLAVEVTGLRKRFGDHEALAGVDVAIAPGEMVALLGASGSGKSTLLRHLCGLTIGDAGHVRIFGRTIQVDGVPDVDLRRQRAEIAVIFQQFNLVDRLPVMLNVLAGSLHRQPLWRGLLRRFPHAEYGRAWRALERVGIAQCAWQRASTLSGGQQQRAAISRAIVQGARLALADEPIASLDPESARNVMDLLAALNRDQRVTVLVSLHQIDFAFAYCPRTIALHRGRVVYDGPTGELTPARLRDLYGSASDELFGGTRAIDSPEAADFPGASETAGAVPNRVPRRPGGRIGPDGAVLPPRLEAA